MHRLMQGALGSDSRHWSQPMRPLEAADLLTVDIREEMDLRSLKLACLARTLEG